MADFLSEMKSEDVALITGKLNIDNIESAQNNL
jgi:hypothetical protein